MASSLQALHPLPIYVIFKARVHAPHSFILELSNSQNTHSNGREIVKSGARKMAKIPIQTIARWNYLKAKGMCGVVNLFRQLPALTIFELLIANS